MNLRKRKWLVIGIYKPPQSCGKMFIERLSNQLNDLHTNYDKILLLFDFFDNHYLRIHWRLLTILETSNKKVWSKVFWYKTNLKKIPLGQNKRDKRCPLFSFASSKSSQFYSDLRFLDELKHKVCPSKTVCGIFDFQFRFGFIKVYIFVQQNAQNLWL